MATENKDSIISCLSYKSYKRIWFIIMDILRFNFKWGVAV